ncbi:alcohol dehydrogenase catalytic domain-containing protein [Aestuariivita sp.]|jgi:threonine dehydrogenase-like Zn-dependent dehydrogenase|uniref:zinc-dependent alcohol dehydrogenase n=1 Tax=Aestuariivita sp. TaxID=1872407 RepID=UPI0021728DAE|nr:alcohol dehydrogenase catalytic domain-containing protein [Aestuariivita sp.]MCE8009027.1 alcohol dehydrogenase catalytic domain-containing protein [Aestuariivita sp.]
MKALVYTGPEELAYRDAPDPAADKTHPLIRIDSVGICGSDMHAYLGHDDRRPAPLILGHEGAGTVVGGPRDGQRVTINPLVTCGICRACKSGRDNLCTTRQIISMPPRQGAFAQYVAMPDRNLVAVPDDCPLEKAALAEPIAVSWHAIRLGLEAVPRDMTETALVIGGGAIGVAAALSLLAQGVTEVTLVDPNPLRRSYLGLEAGYAVAAPEDVEGRFFDITVDAVGFDATRATAAATTHPGGVILHIGLGGGHAGLDIRRMTLQEITFIGTYTYTARDFRDTCTAMFDGRLGPLDWTETRPLSEGARAFSDIRSGRIAAPKILLKPQ